MNRQKVNALLAVLLETIAEVTPKGGAPRGVLYSALMEEVDLGGYESLEAILLHAELVERKGDCLLILPRGTEMVAQIAAAKSGVAK